ncbi:MAG TPA: gamma-glutamyl-gamma-aminobutyrate hydrolase family protein [Armatimonadota bacterium]|jgi:putative glutamine amidotransferase
MPDEPDITMATTDSSPIIMLTAGRQNHYAPRREVQTVTFGCDVDYLHAVQQAGGVPVMLPGIADESSVQAALAAADGLLLTGGGDIMSLAYGEEPHEKSTYQDPLRDAMELAAARQALALGLPILGICRGLQLLNVALGGTLVQDIPSQVPGANKHYSSGLDVVLLHTIEVDDTSLLARIMGSGSLAVNSWHHQAVKELGHGLRISARARDGVVEAIESAEGKPLLAVQCHPEECVGTYPHFRKLFDWLVNEARAHRMSHNVSCS